VFAVCVVLFIFIETVCSLDMMNLCWLHNTQSRGRGSDFCHCCFRDLMHHASNQSHHLFIVKKNICC